PAVGDAGAAPAIFSVIADPDFPVCVVGGGPVGGEFSGFQPAFGAELPYGLASQPDLANSAGTNQARFEPVMVERDDRAPAALPIDLGSEVEPIEIRRQSAGCIERLPCCAAVYQAQLGIGGNLLAAEFDGHINRQAPFPIGSFALAVDDEIVGQQGIGADVDGAYPGNCMAAGGNPAIAIACESCFDQRGADRTPHRSFDEGQLFIVGKQHGRQQSNRRAFIEAMFDLDGGLEIRPHEISALPLNSAAIVPVDNSAQHVLSGLAD